MGDRRVGAIAPSLGFSVLTVNLRHFRLIPGLGILQIQHMESSLLSSCSRGPHLELKGA